jgi:hypothetical protein
MNKDEIVRALGEPTEKRDYGDSTGIWIWQLPPGRCLRYDGDNCVEREKKEQTIFFTAKGNASGQSGCETLSGEYVYFTNSELFPERAAANPRPKRPRKKRRLQELRLKRSYGRPKATARVKVFTWKDGACHYPVAPGPASETAAQK